VAQRESGADSACVKIYLYYIGKPRDAHSNSIAADFIKRVGHFCTAEMRQIVPERIDLWSRHARDRKILLDPAGKTMDSCAFTNLIRRAELDARDLVFVVGGADGLPSDWRGRADLLLSLSSMTLPHELARAVLTEQIYRAFATLRGHPYPR
jgi:23S rRNA (pseudouridine1915-N3)-methyltransferase